MVVYVILVDGVVSGDEQASACSADGSTVRNSYPIGTPCSEGTQFGSVVRNN